jgi:hypothetical protein
MLFLTKSFCSRFTWLTSLANNSSLFMEGL